MAYIGNQPTDNFVTFATQNFSTSATSSYTLSHAVSNENEIALFINNVRQHPGSGKAYTATGTALTLSANTASTDVMYCIFLGRAIQSTVPATNSITAAMVGNDLISGKDALASEPADTDEFLISDAGTLKRIDYSLIKGGGITEADMWRLTANTSGGTNADISSNLERVDDASFGYIGSGMSQSSGVFTFPSTGIYEVSCVAMIISNGDINAMIEINVTTNNSSYDPVVNLNAGNESGDRTNISVGGSTLVDVTNTSNVKVKFTTTSFGSDTRLSGDSTSNYTYFKFIRLGDT